MRMLEGLTSGEKEKRGKRKGVEEERRKKGGEGRGEEGGNGM